jgi:hypothetical protein
MGYKNIYVIILRNTPRKSIVYLVWFIFFLLKIFITLNNAPSKLYQNIFTVVLPSLRPTLVEKDLCIEFQIRVPYLHEGPGTEKNLLILLNPEPQHEHFWVLSYMS